MEAYKNDPKYKTHLLESARQHRLADEYIEGKYGQMGRSVDFLIHDINKQNNTDNPTDNYQFLANQLEIPLFILKLHGRILDRLSKQFIFGWTERLLGSINPGIDLMPVLPVFLLKTINHLPKQKESNIARLIKDVKEVLQNWVTTGHPDINAANITVNLADDINLSANSAGKSQSITSIVYFSAKAAAYGDPDIVAEAVYYASGFEYKQIGDDLIASIEEVTAKQQTEKSS